MGYPSQETQIVVMITFRLCQNCGIAFVWKFDIQLVAQGC